MRKKIEKIALICAVVILSLAAVVFGTLGFLNRSDWEWEEQNSDRISVELLLQRREYDGEGNLLSLAPMDGNMQLVPFAESGFDKYGIPTSKNFFDYIVRVENSGDADAYVRVIIAVPSVLEEESFGGKKILHWEKGEYFAPDGNFEENTSPSKAFEEISESFGGKFSIGGVECNLYVFTFNKALEAGGISEAAPIVGFSLDENAEIKYGKILINGADTGISAEEIAIYSTAQAIQSDGLLSAKQAFAASAFPENPWE